MPVTKRLAGMARSYTKNEHFGIVANHKLYLWYL